MADHVEIPKAIKRLLNLHKSLELLPAGNKVKCRLTGHEMPCRAEAIEAYISGKKYKRLSVAVDKTPDPAVYREYLVPSNKRGHERQLFCKITYRHVNNLPHHIAQHFSGKRFQTAYLRWQKCQETGEVFKANLGRTRQRTDPDSLPREKKKKEKNAKKDDEDDDDDDDDTDTDSLSDLLPVDYFEDLDINGADSSVEGGEGEDLDLANGDVDEHKSNGKHHTNGAADASSRKLKRKLTEKKKPAVLKTVKAKKFKSSV